MNPLKRYAVVTVVHARSEEDAHNTVVARGRKSDSLIYVGRGIEVPRGIEYSTDSVGISVDGKASVVR